MSSLTPATSSSLQSTVAPTTILREKWNTVTSDGDKKKFIKAVIKNDICVVRKMLSKDLIDNFVRTRKGEMINPLYVCVKK